MRHPRHHLLVHIWQECLQLWWQMISSEYPPWLQVGTLRPVEFMQAGRKRSGLPGDKPLKKRLKKSSAEPDGQAGGLNGKSGRGVMGLNPLVGHKVDRFWAEVGSC